MPELPEVEAVCRKLRRDARGAAIVRARVLRAGITGPQAPALVERLAAGQRIEEVSRRGKNILLRLSNQHTVRVHLRMTGNLYVIPDVRLLPAAARMVFELPDGRGLVFDDPRALGKVAVHDPEGLERFLRDIGIEPFSPEFTAEWLAGQAARSRQAAKLFLMDQRRAAGLGNIYAAEALFRARIHPAKPVNRVSAGKLRALHAAVVSVLEDAVQSACIAYARPGRFQEAERFTPAVYGREGEPCFSCSRRIRRFIQNGRSTYFCPGCQR